MRIGMLTSGYPRWPGDLCGAFVAGLAETLAARGHEIEVLAPRALGGQGPARKALQLLGERAAAETLSRVHCRRLAYAPHAKLESLFHGEGFPETLRRSPARAFLGGAAYWTRLRWELHRSSGAWDVLMAHWAFPLALASPLSPAELPLFGVFHSGDLALLESLPLRSRWAERLAARLAWSVFVSDDLRRRFLALLRPASGEFLASRSSVQAMGIAPSPPVDRERARALHDCRGFILLTMSRLSPIKGVDRVLAAMKQVEGATLLVAGAGPERPELEAYARHHRLPVRFVGLAQGETKRTLFAAADAFIAASRVLDGGRSEGCPTTVLEAMATGLPLIVSASGGLGEIVREGEEGFVLPSPEPSLLAERIRALMADPALRERFGERGKRSAAAYLWSRVAPRFEDWCAKARDGRAAYLSEPRNERLRRRPWR